MQISVATALVTGANRGIGRHLAAELLKRDAAVYAAARKPEEIDLPGVTAIRIDITDRASVAAAADIASDVTLLINNAGVSTGSDLLLSSEDAIRLEMDTHFFGTLSVIRAFAPRIAANGGGTILNAQSIRVIGLYVGSVDTDMTAHLSAPKVNPADLARMAVDAIEQDQYEVIVDDSARRARSGLSEGLGVLYPGLPE